MSKEEILKDIETLLEAGKFEEASVLAEKLSGVAESVRKFKIGLNDCDWSSPEARAKGLRDLGIAQLGSLGVVDDREFLRLMQDKIIREVISDLLCKVFPNNPNCLNAAEVCKREGTIESAKAARRIVFTLGFSRSASYAGFAASAVSFPFGTFVISDVISNAHLAVPEGDHYLLMVAKIALEVLRELKSPGCEYL